MNRELKRVSAVILAMFVALLCSSTIITTFQVDNLRADKRNVRTLYESYSAERGAIVAGDEAIAITEPANDEFKFQRVYTNPELYSAVTGYFTINQGSTGIESELNDYLTGTANDQFLAHLNAILTGQTPKGASVLLTIDPTIQQAAWDALGDNFGSVVALDPKTGAILAMVSKPSFDPNRLASHVKEDVVAAYDELLADPSNPLINRAIAGDLYHPGSVFKLVVASAALDSGRYTAESTFPNPALLELPLSTATIRNSDGGTCGPGQSVSIAEALRLSCNIPFAELGAALGGNLIRKYATEYGFGDELNIPMDVTPSVFPKSLDAPQLMLSSFGQYDVKVTPLQMAMVTAGIANEGRVMKPNLVKSITAPDLSVIKQFDPEVYRTPISPETSAILTQLMVNNVDNGAASNGRISGVDVAGKTGTAENGKGEQFTLWFTGFAPASDPQVAVAVVVENGGTSFGNAVAAPIARKVIEAVLNK